MMVTTHTVGRLRACFVTATATLLFFALATDRLSSQPVNLSGIVSDAESGDALIGATVLLYELDSDTTSSPVAGSPTNEYGFYSIPGVSSGEYILVARSIGYTDTRTKISTETERRHDISMVRTDPDAEVVVVVADRGPETRAIGRTTISVEEITRLPALGGESDVLRVLQMTPSVQPSSEISSGLNVRGGSADQSLILLDEVVIYNPSHIGGFLSTFNSNALQNVELISGGFPAKFGGRLSSVLNLTSREGTREKFTGSGGVSLLSSQLTVEGPIGDDVTFMASGRRFYLDLITDLLLDTTSDIPDYHFYDLNAKIAWSASDVDRFYLSGYTGRDALKSPRGEEYNINWGNSTLNFRWARILASDLFANLSLSYTGYDFESRLRNELGDEESEFVASTRIDDLRLKANASWFPHEDHIVQFGVEGVRHLFDAGILGSGADPLGSMPSIGSDDSTAEAVASLEVAAYLQDEWQVSDDLALNLGARTLWFEKGSHTFLEPRGSATFRIAETLRLQGSIALAHQPVHLVIRNDLSLPTDTWFPATERIEPGRSLQGTLGLAGTIADGLTFSLEAYRKSFENLYEFRDSVDFTSEIPFEDQLTQGTGRAWGVELFVEKTIGDFTGWASYTLAWTDRTFPELNRGQTFSPRFDRRHSLKFVLFYELGESWDFGATWTFSSGQPFTVPTGAYTLLPITQESEEDVESDFHLRQYHYSERNGFRLPPYHRLDLNFTHRFRLFDLPFTASLNVYNLYNRQNVFSWFVRQDFATNEAIPTQLTLFPFLPSFGIGFTF